jgi:hypothetical protein
MKSLLRFSLVVLLGFPALLSAQQAAANINGTVTDSTGAVVEGATVTLTNVDTSVSRSTVSNGTGNYVFVDVLPGPYTLKVVKEGFNTVNQPQFTLQVNQTATLNFTLTVGSTQQSVTVEASAVAIQSSTAELGTVINTQAVNDLPLNGRNFTQLLTLTPGASPVSVGQNSGGGGGFAGNAIGSYSFPALNGQRNRSNMFLLDGINDLGSFIGNYNFEPIVDTVQEFKVQSHNDESEFGQATGGIVNVVTKSGTNVFHGSLWEFVRNSSFDARNFFQAKVNPLRQNQFGAELDGPLWIPKVYNGKNRTFFEFGWESYRQSQATQSNGLTPTPAQLSGDFSTTSAQLYNPFSTRPDPSKPGSYLRDPFPGNLIPANLLNPAAIYYAKTLLPAPNLTGVAGANIVDNTPQRTNQDSYQGRIDQNFGQSDVLFGRISHYAQDDSRSAGIPGSLNSFIINGWNWALHETHTFGPTMVLDTHFGRNWGDDLQIQTFPNAPANFISTLESLGYSPNFIQNFEGGYGPFIPQQAISGYISAGGKVQDTRIAQTWEFGGDFTKIYNAHTFKFGANFATDNTVSPIFYVSENYAATQTQNPESPNKTGDPLASYVLGVPDQANKRSVLEYEHGGWIDGLYIQDQWKATSRLTLNFGFRWDVTLWPLYGKPGTPDFYVGDYNLNNGTYLITERPPGCSATQGYPCLPGNVLPPHVELTPHGNRAIFNNDFGDWQGRFGLAYRLTGKTAIRGGYGRFYDSWNSIIQLAQNYEGNWPDVGQLIANNLNQPGHSPASIGDPFGLGSSGVFPTPPTPFTQVNWFVDPTAYKMPYSDQWNFGIEQQLGSHTVLSLSYVGAHDLQLNMGGYRNTAVTPGPGDAATVASRQPYPYITPTYYDQSIGMSKYNAFQFRLQQQTTKGLSYLVSYTRSKSTDLACSGDFGAEGCEVTNPYNFRQDYSVSGFDLPNIFSGSALYQVPIGKGRSFSTGNRFADYIIGNWDISGIVSIHSGVPFDVTTSNGNISNTGNVTERANLVLLNPYPAKKTPSQWINPAAFATPAPYTYGNLGRNTLRNDSTKNLDLSIIRRFPIKETTAFEFRADSFNLTNTPVFSSPHSTLGNSNFATITSTQNSARQLQFSLKLVF